MSPELQDPDNCAEIFVSHVEPMAAANGCVYVSLAVDRPHIVYDIGTASAVTKRVLVARLVLTAAAAEQLKERLSALQMTVAVANSPADPTKPN